MSKTAIVILNWNGIEFLKKFLGIVVELSSSPETEIYLADNGSSDGSIDWTAENLLSVKLLKLENNYGFAEGYNRALKLIDADYYILLNSDIEPSPGWTLPLISFMDNNPDVASCQPKILSWHNRQKFEYAGAAGGYIDKYGYPFCRGRIFSNIEEDSGQYNSQKDIFWSSGACMIVRAEAWKKCGGFDPDFFAHMEEIDLCWRFKNSGYRICFIPNSVVFHVGGGMLPYNSPFKTYLNFRNNLYLLYKNLPEDSLHLTLFFRKLLDALAASSFLIAGDFANFRSVWKAHMDYYKNIGPLKMKREAISKLNTVRSSFGILNKSVVIEFYIKRKKTFDDLKMNI